MKRHHKIVFLALAILFGTVTFAQQSLGDAARAAQSRKKNSSGQKVYTNDDIEGTAPIAPPATTNPKPDAAVATTKPEENPTPATKTAEPQSAPKDEKTVVAKANDWKVKLEGQKKVIADLGRELNLMEREHQVRVATYYADAGNQLRDSKKWFEDEKKYEDDHAALQKSLADANQKLDNLKEEARHAGAPASVLD